MKFYLFPKYMEEAAKSGWIVRFLKIVGVVQAVLCAAAGVFLGGPYASALIFSAGLMDRQAASASGSLLGLAVGIVVGLWTSLPVFALAQVIDDLHALRIHTAAYVAFETDEPRLGR